MANFEHKKREKSDFKFVNIERPADAANERVRRQVRSHVSRLQHRQNRERLSHQASRSRDIEFAKEASGASNSIDSSEDGQLTVVAPAKVRNKTPSWIRHSTESDSTPDESTEIRHISPPPIQLDASPSVLTSPTSALEKAFSRGSLAFRTISLNDPDNIIGRNVAELRLDLSSIMSFYRMISMIQAQDFDQQYGAVIPGVTSWKRFYAFVFTDPVMLTTAILLTARHQFEVLGRDSSGEDGVRIANMERFLLQRINEALQDPIRGISDQMLIAVALYAAYEIKHGNCARYHIHMSGLVQMINLRGGLREIGQQDPYVERMLLWQDANTATLAGIQGYLHDLDSSLGQLSHRPQPNPRMFQLL
jgi:hypothetical protein